MLLAKEGVDETAVWQPRQVVHKVHLSLFQLAQKSLLRILAKIQIFFFFFLSSSIFFYSGGLPPILPTSQFIISPANPMLE